MKKFRSKWFRVAVEGATTDGRNIERTWIEEMAATYDPKTYGARIWMEHFRSVLADGPFRAYGDVLALKAEEVEIDGKTRLALFAQIEPTNDLVNMVNKLKQKIFTSIEVMEKFAGTGKAYLMGLAVTDTPASLGTEMLAFAAQNPEASPLKARKQSPDSMFSALEEAAIEFEEVEEKLSLFARVQALLKGSQDQTQTEFSQMGEAIEAIAVHVKEQAEAFAEDRSTVAAVQQQLSTLQQEFKALVDRLGSTTDHSQQQRPPATGGDSKVLTQF
jgi:hypothetical protein